MKVEFIGEGNRQIIRNVKVGRFFELLNFCKVLKVQPVTFESLLQRDLRDPFMVNISDNDREIKIVRITVWAG